ncbi:MAG TPA: sulfite exporter TauE/SafE family protein [archaeon]|nr:sulfite exporter TauE/SafE family protein [archaeon]
MIISITGGVLAGMLGGLLGIGGGILLMPILRLIFGLSPACAAGTCIVAVFFTTLGGSFRHYQQGHINFRSISTVIIAGAISTTVFSLIFIYFTKKGRWLDLGTGLVFSLVSVRMILEGSLDLLRKRIQEPEGSEIRGSRIGKAAIGSLAGILPGLLGIGTGAILVPAFVFILKAPIKIAIGSSLACFSVNALVSSTLKLFQGFVNLELAIPLCIGTLAGSNIGAVLNKRFRSSVLKIMFGTVFTYVSVKYILLFFEG